MSLSLLITIISGAVVFCFLMSRTVEVFTGRNFVSTKKRSFADNVIHKFLLAVLENTAKIKRALKRHLYLLPGRILKLTYVLWLKMKKRIDHFYDKLQNRRRS